MCPSLFGGTIKQVTRSSEERVYLFKAKMATTNIAKVNIRYITSKLDISISPFPQNSKREIRPIGCFENFNTAGL